MKSALAVLAGSLAANIALVAALVLRVSPAAARSRNEVAPLLAVAAAASPAAPGADAWARLTDGNLDDLAARLRAEDFPPAVRRAIAAAQLNKRFAERRAALAAAQAALPYWRSDPLGMMHDPRLAIEARMLQRDFDAQLRQLLEPGSSGLSPIELEELGRNFGNPPVGKIERLRAIQLHYDELAAIVRAEAKPRLTPTDHEKLAELERQRRADLAELLTPAELENFEMRASATAKRLRSEMRAWDFTEAEFRALFPIQQAIDTLENLPDSVQWQQARKERLPRFRDVLGLERFAEFQTATHPAIW